MITEYNGVPYCVNRDWLAWSVLTDQAEPEILCPTNYRLEVCQGNNIFEHRAILYDGRGGKVLTLLWKPYSAILPSTLMTVQLSNEYLYLPNGQGIKWAESLLAEIVACQFKAIGRLDVCIDFVAMDKQLQFIRHLNSNHYYVQRKSEGSTWWHATEKSGYAKQQLHALAWGSKKSDIKVKLYHKSREQGLVGGNEPDKPWIVEEWKYANFTDITAVWRLEFSLQGVGSLTFDNRSITLADCADGQWCFDRLCELYHSRFVCRVNAGKVSGHHNNDPRRYLIELPQRGSGLRWKECGEKDTPVPPAITLLRSLMRQTDNATLLASPMLFEHYYSTITRLIDSARLEGYFKRTYNCTPDDYFSELSRSVGSGIRAAAASPRILQD